jgi:hypothetical protein
LGKRQPLQQAGNGGAIECNAPTKTLDASTRNLQNVNEEYDEQLAKKAKNPATLYPIHVLPLFNCCGWIQFIL